MLRPLLGDHDVLEGGPWRRSLRGDLADTNGHPTHPSPRSPGRAQDVQGQQPDTRAFSGVRSSWRLAAPELHAILRLETTVILHEVAHFGRWEERP